MRKKFNFYSYIFVVSVLAIIFVVFYIYEASVVKERRVKVQISASNYCEVDNDCVVVDSKCPFDCYVFVNQDNAVEVKKTIDEYESKCVYGCAEKPSVKCEQNKCIAVSPEEMKAQIDEKTRKDLEDKIGKKCSFDLECELPFYYAVRSNCPFRAVCYQGSCQASCRKPYESEEAAKWGGPQCMKNEDCNCAHYSANDLSECVCHNGFCSAIVSE